MKLPAVAVSCLLPCLALASQVDKCGCEGTITAIMLCCAKLASECHFDFSKSKCVDGPEPPTPKLVAPKPEVIDLYAKANTSMTSILQANGNFKNGKAANALVVFHLDGCVFCEMTLGTILYNYAHENIFAMTGVQTYQILVQAEGTPVAGHVYCAADASCSQQAKDVLGLDVASLKGFPTSYYYDANGKVSAQIGDTPCGIAVRRDAASTCTHSNLTDCAYGSNDMDNWLCNLKDGTAPTDCKSGTSTEWHRCKRKASSQTILV